MPRFLFDLSDGCTTIADDHGVDCASLEDAEQRALKTQPMVARHGRERDTLATFVIRDARGTPLTEVVLTLSVALFPEGVRYA